MRGRRPPTMGPRRSPGRPRRAERSGGFTLLEVLVVLVIASVMYVLVLGVPLRGASIADLKAAARTLASGLRQAQTLAMVTRRDALLTVDVEERGFVLAGETELRRIPRDIEIKLFTAQSELIDGKRGAIRFYPDGSSTGGRITVSAGERKYLVDVDWLTGRVAISD